MVRWEGNIYDWDVELILTSFLRTESNDISDILDSLTEIQLASLARKGFDRVCLQHDLYGSYSGHIFIKNCLV